MKRIYPNRKVAFINKGNLMIDAWNKSRTVLIILFTLVFSLPLLAQESYKVLAIRVEFQVDNDELTTGDGTFNLEETTPDSIEIKLDPSPHNKSFFSDHLEYLKNYFHKVSREEIDIEYDCFPAIETEAYQLPQQMAFYNPNTTQDKIDEGLALLFYDSWNLAAQDPEINISDYNCFYIFHAGVGKDIALAFDETSQDIPSLYITPSFLEANLPDGLPPLPESIGEGAILPETESQDDYELALNGLIVSNFATFLGLPDMFNAETQKTAVGIFDLMDVGFFNGQGLLPSIPMAWHRIRKGWDTAVNITSANDSLLQIGNFEQNEFNSIYKFPITSSEYFLVEMRAPGEVYIDSLRYEEATNEYYPNVKEILLGHYSDLVEFSERGVLTNVENLDIGISGSGILIWHVDDNVINARIENNEPINNDENHRGIDLEEADGSQDIGEDVEALTAGSGSENGWLLDMFYSENNAPMYETNNESFSPYTIPASTSNYMNGNSHLVLSDFSNADTVMSFKVNFDLFEPGFPVKLPFTNKVKMIKAFENITLDDNTDLIIGTGKNVYIFDVENASIIDSINLKDSLQTVIKSEKRPYSFIVVDYRQAYLQTFESGEFNPIIIDSSANNTKYTQAVLLPDTETDFLFLGNDNGEIKVNSFNSTEINNVFDLKVLDEKITAIYPYICENDVYAIVQSDENHILISLTGNTVSQMPDIIGDYGLVLDGWIIENFDESTPVFYFLTDQGNLMSYDCLDNELMHLKNIETSPLPKYPDKKRHYSSEPTYLLPIQWNNYGEWITSLAVLGNDIQLVNLSGVPLVNFPQTLINQHMSGKYVAGYPVFTPGLSSQPELNYFPVLVSVNDELENSSTETNGMLLALYDRNGKVYNESYLPFSGNYLSSTIFPGISPVTTKFAVLDSTGGDQNLSLFRLPFSPIFNMGYDNLSQYNQKYYKSISMFITDSPVSLNGLMPKKLVYNWPNPVKDEFTHIRYYLTESATVNISIYDQAGFKVWETEENGIANMDNEVIWNVSNISSGVYFARVRAKSGSKEETTIVKIAVVK